MRKTKKSKVALRDQEGGSMIAKIIIMCNVYNL
jgi:hypothetical protein